MKTIALSALLALGCSSAPSSPSDDAGAPPAASTTAAPSDGEGGPTEADGGGAADAAPRPQADVGDPCTVGIDPSECGYVYRGATDNVPAICWYQSHTPAPIDMWGRCTFQCGLGSDSEQICAAQGGSCAMKYDGVTYCAPAGFSAQ